MTDTPQWPLVDRRKIQHHSDPHTWSPSDPLEMPSFEPLVLPPPLVDKALINRDDEETMT